jgi:[acyl-carrier-protein] S-malonyltransferase
MNNSQSALLFPGQGAQEPGMGRDLAEADSEIMDLWKRAEKISNIPLRGLYWEGGENIDDTRRLQVALTAANLSLWMALARHFKPAAAAGHSLGEYSAIAAAGALDFDSVLQLVTLRGRLMAEADPAGIGGMAALVKLTREKADELVAAVNAACPESGERELRIANFNTPAQFVVSGTRQAIAALAEKAREFKGRALPLAVSGAFHSPLMAEAAKEFAAAIKKYKFSKPKFPVYCNVTGLPEVSAEGVKQRLVEQMTSSVQWILTIRNQFNAGIRCFVECGPKNVLGKMVAPILEGEPGAAEGVYKSVSVSSAVELQEFRQA